MGPGRQLTNSATSVLWFIYLLERLWVGKFEVGEGDPESAQDCSEAGNAARPASLCSITSIPFCSAESFLPFVLCWSPGRKY